MRKDRLKVANLNDNNLFSQDRIDIDKKVRKLLKKNV